MAYYCERVLQNVPDREKVMVTTRVDYNIGSFVRARRKANRLSQRDLGDLAGVGTRFISELERGKPTLRLDSVNKVLAVFGMTLGIVEATKQDGSV